MSTQSVKMLTAIEKCNDWNMLSCTRKMVSDYEPSEFCFKNLSYPKCLLNIFDDFMALSNYYDFRFKNIINAKSKA